MRCAAARSKSPACLRGRTAAGARLSRVVLRRRERLQELDDALDHRGFQEVVRKHGVSKVRMIAAESSERDQGEFVGAEVLPELAREFPAARLGHREIQECDLWATLFGKLYRGAGSVGDVDFLPERLEERAE